jgi:hypothetical protein
MSPVKNLPHADSTRVFGDRKYTDLPDFVSVDHDFRQSALWFEAGLHRLVKVMTRPAMRPKGRREGGQADLSRSRLNQILNLEHALVKPARLVDCGLLEKQFGAV